MEMCRHNAPVESWCGECEMHCLCSTCGNEYRSEEFGGSGECPFCAADE